MLNRKFTRSQAMKFYDNLEPSLIGMKACSSSRHWARKLIQMGRQVRVMPQIRI